MLIGIKQKEHNWKKLFYLFMPFLVILPKTTAAMNVSFKDLGNDTYLITGSINRGDLGSDFTASGSGYHFTAMAYTTPKNNYEYQDYTTCTNDVNKAISIINRKLSAGITVSRFAVNVAGPEWTVNFSCDAEYNNPGGRVWRTTSSPVLPPPPPLPKCTVSSPATIDFSVVKAGSSGTRKDNNIVINCDRSASGKLEIMGTKNGELKINDATVSLLFENNKTQYSFAYSSWQTVKLISLLKNAGDSAGEKKGSIILRLTWN